MSDWTKKDLAKITEALPDRASNTELMALFMTILHMYGISEERQTDMLFDMIKNLAEVNAVLNDETIETAMTDADDFMAGILKGGAA